MNQNEQIKPRRWERSMDASAVANAEFWLSWIAVGKFAAAALVTIGVVMEFGGNFVARPYERTVAAAREQQLLALRAEADDAKTKLEQARAAAAQIDTNLLAEQRLTARERMRLERLERAVLPRSSFLSPQLVEALIADLKAGSFPRINIAFVPRREPQDFAVFTLLMIFTKAGIMGRLIELPKDSNRSGVMIFAANADGSRLATLLWQKYRIGGGEMSREGKAAEVSRELDALPLDENCVIVGDNDGAFQPSNGQPGEGLDQHGRPVPAPQ